MGLEGPAGDHAAYRSRRDPAVRDRLFAEYAPLAHNLARRVAGGRRDADLEQVAALALLRALERYDPRRGVPFPAFAQPTIQGELRRHLRETRWWLHVARGPKESYLRARGVADELTLELGRQPSRGEISARAGLPPQSDPLAVGACLHPERLDALAPPYPEAVSQQPGLPGVEDPGYEAAEARAILSGLMRRLSAWERRVLCLRFVDDLTQRQIGEALGVNQMHVSRTLAGAFARLRQ